jgi:hypothetical protein
MAKICPIWSPCRKTYFVFLFETRAAIFLGLSKKPRENLNGNRKRGKILRIFKECFCQVGFNLCGKLLCLSCAQQAFVIRRFRNLFTHQKMRKHISLS